jgi:hypothetical protein
MQSSRGLSDSCQPFGQAEHVLILEQLGTEKIRTIKQNPWHQESIKIWRRRRFDAKFPGSIFIITYKSLVVLAISNENSCFLCSLGSLLENRLPKCNLLTHQNGQMMGER